MQGQGKLSQVTYICLSARAEMTEACDAPSITSTGSLNLSSAPFFNRNFRKVNWPSFGIERMRRGYSLEHTPCPIP